MNPAVYKSKLDFWLLLPLGGATLACVYAGCRLWRLPGMVPQMALLALGLAVVLPLWSVLATRYTLTDEVLQVRSGPFVWRIALRAVNGIEATRDARSSPALSLDRLRIDYGDGRSLMISPAGKQDFVRDFTARRARAPM